MGRLETLLELEAFWCARPDTLNDPEEFAWVCDYDSCDETENLLTDLLVKTLGRPRDYARQRAAVAISNGRLPIIAKPIVEAMIQKCRDEIGLVCFGTAPDNSVLWARYGGNGAGVCIEVDVPVDLLGRQLFRVQYSNTKKLHIDQLIRASLNSDHVQEVYAVALLSKPHLWATEDEIRFVSRKQCVLARIDRSRITRVILGRGLLPSVRERIAQLAVALGREVSDEETVGRSLAQGTRCRDDC